MKELLKSEITDIRWWRDDGGDIDPSLVDDLLSIAKRKVFRICWNTAMTRRMR